MGLWIALKAFFCALKDSEGAKKFINGQQIESSQIESVDVTHLRLLALLQRSGRLIDFLKEDISQFPDAQVGAAARQVHKECATLLEDVVTIRPVYQEDEGCKVRVPAGYDPASVKLIGNVRGIPPFEGVLVHRGWKAHKRSLPKSMSEMQGDVICPAEVELK